jgi:hypothetical protein
MKSSVSNSAKNLRFFLSYCALLLALSLVFSCKRAEKSGGFDILGPADETVEAGEIVKEANQELTKIKVLYKNNEDKREELKKAMEANNAADVQRISNDVVQLINEGKRLGDGAVDKIQKAKGMEINEDYKEYLDLKEESLKMQLDAFENYRQAARALRENYDPKNKLLREKIKEEFKERSENYRKIMEKAREYSKRANELAKESSKKQG